jgi:hypothetical protein
MPVRLKFQICSHVAPPNAARDFGERRAFDQLHQAMDQTSSRLTQALVERPIQVTVDSQRRLLEELRRQIDTELDELERIKNVPAFMEPISLEEERARWLQLALDQKHLREIPRDQVTPLKFLRKGGFGSITHALWEDTHVVMKHLFNQKDFVEEVRLLKRVHDGDFVVKLHGIMYDDDHQPVMIMKFAQFGSLPDYIAKYHKKLLWPQRILLAEQIAAGLGFIHREGILHRDFHAASYLVILIGV